MKKCLSLSVLLLIFVNGFSQSKPNPKALNQTEINKMMEAGMKDMSEAEKVEMRKMMRGVMPALQEQNSKMADYPEFTSNLQLVPKRDEVRLTAIPEKQLLQSEMAVYATTLYNKLITKGDATEIAIAKKIISKNPNPNALGGAAVLCMLQGHPQAAMALSMKAVQTDPSNANWQNNMASLLAQYGYPERAIPVLQKLKKQFPRNSTVLNNLGQAWLGLGEIDSAETNIKRAGRLNPHHPETKQTEGVIEEIAGNTDKATDDYIEAMESSVNPFTEMLIKNNNGQSRLNKLDFEKLKRSITTYEYFPKNWITIPKLSDNISGFENDMAIKNGFYNMFEKLDTVINLLKNAAEQEINTSMDKGDDVSFKEMANESLKGYSMMSKPALVVQQILLPYFAKMMMEYSEDHTALLDRIQSSKDVITKMAEGDQCADWDRRNNEFLSYANPLIRAFHEEKIEEFRSWLNTYCTWVWYLAGNPKNTSVLYCVGMTEAFTQLYQDAMHDQRVDWRSCVKHNGDDAATIQVPEIPNFTCPAVVSIPVGADWQQLSNAAKNFNTNTFAVKQSANNPVPNGSLAFSSDQGTIAQAGRDPFTKMASGSMTPGMINDEELTPLSKIPLDDLTPLSKIPLDDLTPLSKIPSDDLTPLPDLRKSNLARDLLKKMMTADCKNVKDSKDILKEALERMMKGVRELEAYEHVIEQIKKLESEIEQKEADQSNRDLLKKQIEKMQQEVEKMDKYEDVQQSKKEIEKIMNEMDVMDDKKFMQDKFNKIMQAVDEMEAAPAILKNIQQNGLQPSISSGIQAPGTFTPVKGLFN